MDLEKEALRTVLQLYGARVVLFLGGDVCVLNKIWSAEMNCRHMDWSVILKCFIHCTISSLTE